MKYTILEKIIELSNEPIWKQLGQCELIDYNGRSYRPGRYRMMMGTFKLIAAMEKTKGSAEQITVAWVDTQTSVPDFFSAMEKCSLVSVDGDGWDYTKKWEQLMSLTRLYIIEIGYFYPLEADRNE